MQYPSARTVITIWDSQIMIYGLLMAHLYSSRWIGVVWWSEPVHLHEPDRIHVTQFLIYRGVHYFAKPCKERENDKRSFIDNPYLLLATRFVYNYTHYQAISVTIFS